MALFKQNEGRGVEKGREKRRQFYKPAILFARREWIALIIIFIVKVTHARIRRPIARIPQKNRNSRGRQPAALEPHLRSQAHSLHSLQQQGREAGLLPGQYLFNVTFRAYLSLRMESSRS